MTRTKRPAPPMQEQPAPTRTRAQAISEVAPLLADMVREIRRTRRDADDESEAS